MIPFFELILSVVFVLTSVRFRWLTPAGAVTAGAFGFTLLWLGDAAWLVPVLFFFSTSSVLSKIGTQDESMPSGSRRNAIQVFANGSVAWAMLLAHSIWPRPELYIGFVASLAAATADTWATEIGRMYGESTRSILTGRIVRKGESGGVSLQGTVGAITGAALLGVIAAWLNETAGITVVAVAGFAGSLVDSLIGASVQGRFRDPETAEETEQRTGPVIRGWSWMTNDAVNLMCTLTGGGGGILVYWFTG